MSRHIHIPGSHTQNTTGEFTAHTSGWKAWQDPGRRRGFWERILSHLTEALCAELTVKVTTLHSPGDPGVKIWEVSGPASRFRMGSTPLRGRELAHKSSCKEGNGGTGWALHPKSELLHDPSATPSPLGDVKDIFDFCGLLEDGRVGAAVTGKVCH